MHHKEVPRLGVKLELRLPALYHSHSNSGSELRLCPMPLLIGMLHPLPTEQGQGLNPILMDTSQVHYC